MNTIAVKADDAVQLGEWDEILQLADAVIHALIARMNAAQGAAIVERGCAPFLRCGTISSKSRWHSRQRKGSLVVCEVGKITRQGRFCSRISLHLLFAVNGSDNSLFRDEEFMKGVVRFPAFRSCYMCLSR